MTFYGSEHDIEIREPEPLTVPAAWDNYRLVLAPRARSDRPFLPPPTLAKSNAEGAPPT